MNKSVYRLSLDIYDTASQSSINAKKGDTARSIYITLQENGKPYRIAEGCHAVFTGVKADGNYLFNDCTIKNNVIIYDFTEQTVPVVGQVHCEVALYDANNERITSPRFDIIVNDVVYNDEEIFSSDEATALISATAEAKAITAEVEQKLANGDFVGEPGPPGPEGPRGPQGVPGERGKDGKDGIDGNDYVLTEADKEEIANMAKPPIDQHFNPTSPHAQSGIAIEERLKSRVLLDVTLNAEQAGATSLSLEIADAETLANAKEIQLHISFPCAESKGAGTVWTSANIKYSDAYNIPILSTDNSACSAGSKLYTTSRTFIYGISEYSGAAASKTSFSIIQRSNQYIASAANSRTAPSSMNSNYPYGLMVNPQTPPSLVITNSIAFEAGTRVYMEVYY